MTPEERQLTHAALDRHNGNRAAAADELGITYEAIKQRIRGDEALKLKWATLKPVNPIENVDPDDDEPLLPAGVKAPGRSPIMRNVDIKALAEREENTKRLYAGLQSLRLSQPEVDLAVNLQNFQHEHLAATVDILGGGMTRQAIRLMKVLDDLTARIEQGYPDTELGLEARKNDYTSYFSGCERLQKMTGLSYQVALEKAKYELKKKQLQEGLNDRVKPRFNPIINPLQAQKTAVNISAAAGATVQVTTPPAGDPATGNGSGHAAGESQH